MRASKWLRLLAVGALAASLGLAGCAGDDGSDGKNGTNGTDGNSTVTTTLEVGDANCPNGGTMLQVVDPDGNPVGDPTYACNGVDTTAQGAIESCAACHEEAGGDHQAAYNDTHDTTFKVSIDSVVAAPNGDGTFQTTMQFTITKDGLPYTRDVAGGKIDGFNQQRYTYITYDPATRMFPVGETFPADTFTSDGNGVYTIVADALPLDITDGAINNAAVYMYFAQGPSGPSHGHVQLYNDVVNVGLVTAGTIDYVSATTEAACGRCHGLPYLKHGYRGAAAAGLPDFAACKACHYDTRSGSDGAEFFGDETYAYTANVMTDTHASHLNLFPYPQTMAACVTCHPGTKLDTVLADGNFRKAVCVSCHADVDPATNTVVERPLTVVVPHNIPTTQECNECHFDGGIGPTFSEIHGGYDMAKYASAAAANAGTLSYTYVLDSVNYDAANATLTIKWGAQDAAGAAVNVLTDGAGTAAAPAFLGLPADRGADADTSNDSEGTRILVGYYGWGTHNMADYENMNTTAILDNSTYDAGTGLATTTFALTKADRIETLHATTLAVGLIGVPWVDSQIVAVKSVAQDFVLADVAADGTATLVARDTIADNAKCDACHDHILIHADSAHGHTTVGNVNDCAFCHNVASAAGHLEEQSRSIDSYLHGIHAQGTVSLDESVAEEFVFPMFTTQNCQACHPAGAYEVPNQYKVLGGVINSSGGNVTVGPASRACGSCHRALDLYEDNAGTLAAINQHTAMFGYRVPTSTLSFIDVTNYIMDLLAQQ